MEPEFNYYVLIVPKNDGDFRPIVLDYGLSYEKASERMRWYINDHGLNYKENGRQYRAFIHIKRTTEPIPTGYRLMALKDVKGVLYET